MIINVNRDKQEVSSGDRLRFPLIDRQNDLESNESLAENVSTGKVDDDFKEIGVVGTLDHIVQTASNRLEMLSLQNDKIREKKPSKNNDIAITSNTNVQQKSSCLDASSLTSSLQCIFPSSKAPSTVSLSESAAAINQQHRHHKQKKVGHRRVNEIGVVSYKSCPVSELSGALRLGIMCSVQSIQPEDMARDVLLQDFSQIATHDLPAIGTKMTPAHNFRDFSFRAYAPVAFQHFRSKFRITIDDYMKSLCYDDWTELPNAGASGSVFYVTKDDRFIIKTVDAREGNFLVSLLPGYYMNLVQNPETMLPKFFGFYCYQRTDKNIRVVIMNNLVSSDAHVYERYDLKGSRYKRRASERERHKNVPTFKDLDFMENHPAGLLLQPSVFNEVVAILERDLRVLRSFEIMDYSLLVVLCKPMPAHLHQHSKELPANDLPETHKKVRSYDTEMLTSRYSLTNYDNLHPDFIAQNSCNFDHENSDSFPRKQKNFSDSHEHHKLGSSTENQLFSNAFSNILNDKHSFTSKHGNSNHEELNATSNAYMKLKAHSNQHNDKDAQFVSSLHYDPPMHVPSVLAISDFIENKQQVEKTSLSDVQKQNERVLHSGQFGRTNVSQRGGRKSSVVSVDCSLPSTAIECWSKSGQRISLFIGIIDILQHYRLQKRVEHLLKTSILAHREISVCDPQYYYRRFLYFVTNSVFRQITGAEHFLFRVTANMELGDTALAPNSNECPVQNHTGDCEQCTSLTSYGVLPTIYSENISATSATNARDSLLQFTSSFVSTDQENKVKNRKKEQDNKKTPNALKTPHQQRHT